MVNSARLITFGREHSYLCLMQYFLLLMNVLLERMVLASWKLKDNYIKYKAFCVVLLLRNGLTQTERQTN